MGVEGVLVISVMNVDDVPVIAVIYIEILVVRSWFLLSVLDGWMNCWSWAVERVEVKLWSTGG
jgi:hypothetical protein